jgi:hypothetical protein
MNIVDASYVALPVGGQLAESQVEGDPAYEQPGGTKVITSSTAVDQLNGDPDVNGLSPVSEVGKLSGELSNAYAVLETTSVPENKNVIDPGIRLPSAYMSKELEN